MAICEQCQLDASELIARSNVADGKKLCRPCLERAERALREKALEPMRRQHETEMAAFRERQRQADLRPDPPELTCRYGHCTDAAYRPAVGIRNGLACCEVCLRAELPGHPEAPLVTLEKRVAELSARLDALQAPKSARVKS